MLNKISKACFLSKITNFIDTHPIGRVFRLGKKKAVWKKVRELKPGLKIAVEKNSLLDWDEIVSIKKVGRERVYDIEVEGTHNFVGNGIVAHNTNISDKIGAFAEVVAAHVKTGLIETKELVVEGSVNVASNIKTGAVETKEFVTGSFTAFQATIDNLLITGGLVSPVVQTNLISPLADSSDVVIKLGKTATSEEYYGKLIVENQDNEEVASIDTSGNATFSGTVNSQQLTVNSDASISGTLYADEIRSKTLEEIEELLKKVEQGQNLLAQASTWDISTSTTLSASDSANLEELVLNNLFVTDQAAINSLSVSNSFALGSDFVISYTSIGTSINTLTAPLAIQSLALAPVEIMAGKIRIETNGDVRIEGNLYIAGNLEVEGQAKLKEITTEKIIIAQSDTSEESKATSEVSTGEIQTNATAGKAKIPAGATEITIKNPKITDYTLVYITPLSSTQNKVLYVKSKSAGFFTVGFTDALDTDVEFNWWVIELADSN